MVRRALVALLAMSPAALPSTSSAYDIKPKTPESAFAAKLHPDILGVSADTSAASARAIFDSSFKGRTDTKTDIQQQKFGEFRRQLYRRAGVQFSPGRKTDR